MPRKVRHLQHGNVTVSINGPAEVVDGLRVALTMHDAAESACSGRAVSKFEQKVAAIGGEWLLRADETDGFAWKNSLRCPPGLEITVFA
jgi:hypothetical protein